MFINCKKRGELKNALFLCKLEIENNKKTN